MIAAGVIALWIAASVLAGPAVGRFIRVGMVELQPEKQPQDVA